MADITSSQIFLFLAKQDDWKAKTDKNKDQEITKGEMREYLSGSDFENYIGMGIDDVSAKVFNEFWAKLDSNVNDYKLDDTEEGKLDTTVANYQKLEELISKNAPNGTVKTENMGKWEARIAELLLEKVESGEKTIDDIISDTSVFIAAYNRATAEVLADQYKNDTSIKSMIASAGIDYDITNDETLNNIINQYIDKVISNFTYSTDENGQPNFTPADINKQIKNLINSYLKTAGLGEGGNIDISKYGYNPESLNGVQNAVVLKKVSDKLSSEKSKFAGYEKEFDEVLNSFIAKYLETSGVAAEGGKSLFESIIGKLDAIKTAFLSSKEYKNLETTMNVYKKYRDNMEDDFKAALKEALGTTDDQLLEACKTDPAYEKVLKNVIFRINSGEEGLLNADGSINWTKVQEAIINAVKVEFSTAADNGEFGIMETDFKNNISDLEKAKEKAIAYCDAAKAKGGEYADAVTNIIGSDYKTIINSYDSSIKLSQKMQLLFDKINELSAIANMTWDDGLKDKEFKQGIKTDFTVSTNLEGVSYRPKNTNDCTVTISGNTVSLTPGEKATSASVDIEIVKDGKVITTKTITVEVSPKTNQDIIANASFSGVSDPSGGHLEVYGAGIDGTQVSAANFADLYNNNAVIQLHTKNGTDGDWNQYKDSATVISRLSNLLSLISGALANCGLDPNKLNEAVQTVKQQFGNTNNWSPHKDRFSGGRANYCAGKIQTGEYPSNTIVKQHDDIKNKGDKVVYMVSFKGLVDAILNAYRA